MHLTPLYLRETLHVEIGPSRSLPLSQSQDVHVVHAENPLELLLKLLPHMQTWVAAVKVSLAAEYPSFEVLQCYSIFQVPRGPDKHTSSALRQERQELSDDNVRVRLKRFSLVSRCSLVSLICFGRR